MDQVAQKASYGLDVTGSIPEVGGVEIFFIASCPDWSWVELVIGDGSPMNESDLLVTSLPPV